MNSNPLSESRVNRDSVKKIVIVRVSHNISRKRSLKIWEDTLSGNCHKSFKISFFTTTIRNLIPLDSQWLSIRNAVLRFCHIPQPIWSPAISGCFPPSRENYVTGSSNLMKKRHAGKYFEKDRDWNIKKKFFFVWERAGVHLTNFARNIFFLLDVEQTTDHYGPIYVFNDDTLKIYHFTSVIHFEC